MSAGTEAGLPDEETNGGWAGDGFDIVDAVSLGAFTGATGDPVTGYQWGSAWSGQFDDEPGGGFSDELGEAAEDAAEEHAPAWLRWILNHQEETAVVVVILVVLFVAKPYAEMGAAATGGSG